MKKTIILQKPRPFDEHFENFFLYGIGDSKIPKDLAEIGRNYIIDLLDEFEKHLKLKKNKIDGPTFVEDLTKLAFGYQYFCERRMGITPHYENVGILSKHTSFKKLNRMYEQDAKAFSMVEFQKHKNQLREAQEDWSKLFDILQELNKSKDILDSNILKVQLTVEKKKKYGGTKQIRIPEKIWSETIESAESALLRFISRIEPYGNISNHEDRALPVIIQMLRGPLVAYVRRLINPSAANIEITKIENWESCIVGIVLSCAGYLKNEKTHNLDRKKIDDDDKRKSYYEYLHIEVNKTKLTGKEKSMASFQEDQDLHYLNIPLMFKKGIRT